MDEFGVLVESIGFRAHGKSAPMKPKPKSHFTANSTAKTTSLNDSYSLPVDELDGIFRSNVNIGGTRQSQHIVDDDIFGGPVSSSNGYAGVDLDSVFSTSNNRKDNSSNLNSRTSGGSNSYDDLLGLKSKQKDTVDDLFGNFELNSDRKQEKKGDGLNHLVSGFGGATPAKTEVYSETNLFSKSNGGPSNSSTIDDPFLVFESSVSQSDASWPFAGPSEQNIGKDSVQSPIDDFGDFTMAGAGSGSKVDDIRTGANKLGSETSSKGFGNANYLDEIFGSANAVHQNTAARPTSNAKGTLFDDFFHEEKSYEVKQTSSGFSFSTKKTTTSTNVGIDFTSLFGDFANSSGEFQEVDGEPEERRRARLNRHMRMNARMAEALAEKNQRDFESQREQEEKRRLAEVLENDIKRWAAGKEGNLRALLSSLEQVLWAECGWRPVSLTDLITSDSVKKAYKKATLYVHPDKVQQKGANLQQKYIAEKVFDILKEAWNKFSAEELR